MENNNEFLKALGMRIRVTRTIRRMTLLQLEGLTGFDKTSLGKVENGKMNTHILTIKAIADAFNMEVKDFL